MENILDLVGNALFRAPQNRAPVPYVSSRGNASIWTDDNGVQGDRVYEAHRSVGTLFAIVSQIGNAVASAQWHLYKRTSTRDKKRRTEILGSRFMELWEQPNPFMTGRFFREAVQQHLDLVGEGIIILERVGNTIVEMWPVRPDRMHPVKHESKFLIGWIYNGPNGEDVPFYVDEVVQLKCPNPREDRKSVV